MKINVCILFLFFLLIFSCEKEEGFTTPIQEILDEGNITSLQVEIYNLDNSEGDLAIAVFNNSGSFDDGIDAYIDSVIPINDIDLTINFDNLPAGSYAISVFHDEDQSGDITFGGFLNLIPQEGFGFSNNPSIGMSQPSYSECSFELQASQTLLVPINIVYL